MNLFLKKLLIVAVLVFLSFKTSLLLAASFGGLGIRPAYPDENNPLTSSWFIYNLLPGEERKDAVVVFNTSDQTLSAKIYAVDGTTTADGAFALLGEGEKKQDVGAWIDLKEKEIVLNPGEEKTIPFEIKVPETSPVGDHLGGIIIESLKVDKGKSINVVTRVGVRIYQTTPGKLIKKLSFDNFYFKTVKDKPSFYFELKNEGNVHLTPKGKLQIKDLFLGKTLAEFDFDLGMVMPEKPTKVPFVWQKPWLLGKFKAIAEVSYGDKVSQKTQSQISFWYISAKAKSAVIITTVFIIIFLLKPFLLEPRR